MTKLPTKKRIKKERFPGYVKIDTGDIITFGTSVFQRNDGRAFIILFPAGSELHLKPCG